MSTEPFSLPAIPLPLSAAFTPPQSVALSPVQHPIQPPAPPPFRLPENLAPGWSVQHARLAALARLGYHPATILDIGAYHGHWAEIAHAIWPAAQIRLIEANEECREALQKTGWPFDIAVLAHTVQKATFHKCQTGCGEGNSLYRENSVFPFSSIEVETQTLDALLSEDAQFDLIKLDCQGCELPILVGGQRTLAKAQIVVLETQLQEYDAGAPFILDVMNQMDRAGWQVYDINEFHYNSRDMLLQVDLMFAKKTSGLFRVRPLS